MADIVGTGEADGQDIRRRIEARAYSRGPIDAVPVRDDVVADASVAERSTTTTTSTATATKAPPAGGAAPSGAIPPRPRKKTKRR